MLASGEGSNLQALIDAHARGDLPSPVVVVISNKREAKVLARARAHGIPAFVVSRADASDPTARMIELLREHAVDVVVLAGWLSLIEPALLRAFPGRVVNIHPAPLPGFGGKGMFGIHVHRAVLAGGVATTGPTVHLVDERYDEGPVLAHREVLIEPDDTPESLQQRVQRAEHDLLWRVIRDRFCASAGIDAPPRTQTGSE